MLYNRASQSVSVSQSCRKKLKAQVCLLVCERLPVAVALAVVVAVAVAVAVVVVAVVDCKPASCDMSADPRTDACDGDVLCTERGETGPSKSSSVNATSKTKSHQQQPTRVGHAW